MDDVAELRREAARQELHGVWAKGGPVYSCLSDDTVHGLEGRTIASFGNAATLGMWAFATGIWTSGLFQANLFPLDQMKLLFPLLLVYSGLVLFIAELFLFRRNNSFLGTAFCSFGAFNLTRGALLCCEAVGVLPSGGLANVLQGCLIESFAYIAFSLLIGSVRMNRVLVGVLLFTSFGFLMSGVAFLADETSVGRFAMTGHIGGYLLIVAGAIAYYGGTALLVNTAWRRVVLPIGGQT